MLRDKSMTTLEEIKSAIIHLSGKELIRFRAWYDEFEAKLWDEQIEKDVQAGKLDKLAEEAIKDFRKNRCTKI